MTTTDPDAALAAALSAFQQAVPKVTKSLTATVPTKNGGSYKYTYAGLPDVTAAVMPHLAKHGLAFSVCPRVHEDGTAVVTGVLLHAAGGRLEASLPLYGRTSQELGSSLTYARRYLLGAMTGVVTDDDDDGNTAEGAPPARREAPAPRRTQPGAPATAEQLNRIKELMDAQGVTDRDVVLTTISSLVGVAVEKPTDLTNAQATVVLDALQQQAGQ